MPSSNRCLLSAFSLLALLLAAGCSPSDSAAAPGGAQSAPAGFCKHEVTEKLCPLCHPEVRKDPNVLICKEHWNIPEELCTACHPELKKKFKTCEHDLPPALCGACDAARKKSAGGGK